MNNIFTLSSYNLRRYCFYVTRYSRDNSLLVSACSKRTFTQKKKSSVYNEGLSISEKYYKSPYFLADSGVILHNIPSAWINGVDNETAISTVRTFLYDVLENEWMKYRYYNNSDENQELSDNKQKKDGTELQRCISEPVKSIRMLFSPKRGFSLRKAVIKFYPIFLGDKTENNDWFGQEKGAIPAAANAEHFRVQNYVLSKNIPRSSDEIPFWGERHPIVQFLLSSENFSESNKRNKNSELSDINKYLPKHEGLFFECYRPHGRSTNQTGDIRADVAFSRRNRVLKEPKAFFEGVDNLDSSVDEVLEKKKCDHSLSHYVNLDLDRYLLSPDLFYDFSRMLQRKYIPANFLKNSHNRNDIKHTIYFDMNSEGKIKDDQVTSSNQQILIRSFRNEELETQELETTGRGSPINAVKYSPYL